MKKIFVLTVTLFAFSVMAENILKNGEFNTQRLGGEIYFGNAMGSMKIANITEEGTTNKCLKLEITSILEKNGRKQISTEVVFGKSNGQNGIPAEPDTEYEIAFDLKSAHQISLWVSLDSKQPAKTYFSEKRIRPVPRVVKGVEGKWTTCKAVFKTNTDTRFIRVHLLLWGDSKQQSVFPFKVGDVLLIDNAKICKTTAADK